MKKFLLIPFLFSLLMSGCAGQARFLPVEAPADGGILRVSRIQGQVGGPFGSGFADTIQIIKLGDMSGGCTEIERDGFKARFCPEKPE